MPARSLSSAKVKVTASLNPKLVETLDKLVKETNAGSRSQLIEEALIKWCNEQKRHRIEKEIEAYYLSLSDQELQEDRQWSQTATEAAKSLWED